MGKKGKKVAKEDEEEEIPEEYRDMSIPMLREKIQGLQYRLVKVAKERNYMQLENDMVKRFYSITQHEVQQCEAEISNKASKMEMIERDHRTHLKVHEQKVLNLEYEHKNNRRLVLQDGEESVAAEKEVHKDRISKHSQDKAALRQEAEKLEADRQEECSHLKTGFTRSLGRLRETMEKQFHELVELYEKQNEELKIDLELKRKCEVHEIEERKNQHINELMSNHQEAFDQIKSYYNDITHDNLQLIKSLKDEIQDMKEQERLNVRKMQTLTVGNKNLAEPLKQKEQMRQELQHQLKSYGKDKLALKNLTARAVQLEENIKEANSSWRTLEEKFSKVEKERDELYGKFSKGVKEIKKKSEYRNVVLERKLGLLTNEFNSKQTQLSEVLAAAKLDPSVVQGVTRKLESVLGQKNTLVKDLEYQIHQATKAYNDTISVFESKLVEMGVPPEELGFEPIPSVTSQMPAGLVTRVP